MQRTGIVMGSVLAALGLLAWLAWTLVPAAGDEIAAAPVAAVPGGATERPPRAPERPAAETEPAIGVSPEPSGAAEARSTAVATRDGAALELIVTDEAGAPLGGAEVWVLADAAGGELGTFHDLDLVDERMTEGGVRHEADRAGRLKIAAPTTAPTLVLASHGQLWDKRRIDAGDEGPIELQLERDFTLRARVLDARGRPLVGATVALRQKNDHWSWSTRDRDTVGADAIATFRHAQRTVIHREDNTWAMGVEALLEAPVEVALDPDALPLELVTLSMPATGSAEVRVFDGTWEKYAGAATASLGIIREGEPRELSPFSQLRRPRIERPVEDGVARFPHVSLGRELEVMVRRDGSRIPTHGYGRGPVVAGESRSFDVRLGSDHPVAVLRAIDGEGLPMAGVALNVRVEVDAQHINNAHEAQVTTDAGGRFEVDLDNDWTEGTERSLIVTVGPRESPEASGEVDAGHRLEKGRNELGDVVLAEARVFVGGRVVSPSGEAVGGARLELHTRGAERTWWNREWSFEHHADAEGRFEVRGDYAGDAFQLGASVDGWAGGRRGFEPGEAALVLELDVEGAVEGRVLLDEGIPTDLLRLRLKDGDHGVQHYDVETAGIDANGTFRFGGLKAGEYAFLLGFEGLRKDLVEAPDVLVRAGETTRDARLELIDLRGELSAHRLILITDEENAPIQGQIHYGPPGAEELESSQWFQEREIDLISEHELLDVMVSARGYRTVHMEKVRGEIEVRLEGGMRVRVKLVGDVVLPDPPIYVKAVLAPVDASHQALDWGVEPFDEGREVVVRSPASGEMKVQWILERRSSGSSIATMAHVEPEQTVEVLDLPEQTVEVSLTREQLEQILTALD